MPHRAALAAHRDAGDKFLELSNALRATAVDALHRSCRNADAPSIPATAARRLVSIGIDGCDRPNSHCDSKSAIHQHSTAESIYRRPHQRCANRVAMAKRNDVCDIVLLLFRKQWPMLEFLKLILISIRPDPTHSPHDGYRPPTEPRREGAHRY
jgi:hypothetical protein